MERIEVFSLYNSDILKSNKETIVFKLTLKALRDILFLKLSA